jgi:drug/metabolite transporter (DMT)-like permease
MNTKKQSTLAFLCITLGNVFWGFSFLFTRVALDVEGVNPNILLSHRFILSTVLMLIPVLIGKVKLSFKGKHLAPVAILLFAQLAYFLTETYAIEATNATVSGLVLAVVPVVTIGTGILFLKEYPTKRQAFFCLLPVIGIILMTVSGKELGVITPLGILFLALMLLFSALYKTVNRKASAEFSPYERTFMVLAISAIAFTLSGLGSVGWNMKAFVAPLAIPSYTLPMVSLSLLCSIVANLLVNYAVARLSVFKAASFGAISTLCTTVGGILFLNEPYNPILLLGAVLIILGIWQITRPVPPKDETKS